MRPTPASSARVDLGVGLVVAVQADVRAGHAAAQRDRQLATGRGVDAQALLVHPAGDSGAEERLARVVDVDVGADRGEGPREALAEGPGPARKSASSST